MQFHYSEAQLPKWDSPTDLTHIDCLAGGYDDWIHPAFLPLHFTQPLFHSDFNFHSYISSRQQLYSRVGKPCLENDKVNLVFLKKKLVSWQPRAPWGTGTVADEFYRMLLGKVGGLWGVSQSNTWLQFGRGCTRRELISGGFLYYCHCHANISAITGCGCVITWIWLVATLLPPECKNRWCMCPQFYPNSQFFPLHLFIWGWKQPSAKALFIPPPPPCCWR